MSSQDIAGTSDSLSPSWELKLDLFLPVTRTMSERVILKGPIGPSHTGFSSSKWTSTLDGCWSGSATSSICLTVSSVSLRGTEPVASLQLRRFVLCGLSQSHILSRIRSWSAQIINRPSLQRIFQNSSRLSLLLGPQLIADPEAVLIANRALRTLMTSQAPSQVFALLHFIFICKDKLQNTKT